ncbi:hypothetical protein NC652_006772 [Populus alba x Populus x berolinensis]|nr:hypothetical protein NC652_006772 [Populus alba x Populus x berolinensis]
MGIEELQLRPPSYLACCMLKGTLQDHPMVGLFLLRCQSQSHQER